MPQLVIYRAALLCVGVLLMGGTSISAQSTIPSGATPVLGAVYQYRMRWLGDSTLFETCSVFRALGPSLPSPHGVDPDLQRIIDRPESMCDSSSASTPTRSRNVVQVRSVTTADSVAHVALTVGRGEYFHNETYELRRRGRGWAIRGVVLSGSIQISPSLR